MLKAAEVIAAGRVKSDGTVNTAGYFIMGATVARAGAGQYDITLDAGTNPGVNLAECTVLASVETNARQYRVTHTSDTVKRVTTEDNAGAAADSDFCFEVKRVKNFLGG